MDSEKGQVLEDDDKDSISLLLKLRLPWLFIGLIGGIAATYISSRFESILEKDIHLAFFIPVIVYMADALGTQTENVYVRNVVDGKIDYKKYIFKETLLGVSIGSLFGTIIGILTYFWLDSVNLAITIGLSLLFTMAIAPLVALLVPSIIQYERKDPALGGGPITTIIQDILSLLIYFVVASFIMSLNS